MAVKTGRRVLGAGMANSALEYAGLGPESLAYGSDPDTGQDCLYLDADIQQYSAFLVGLAVQCRFADELAPLIGSVRLQFDGPAGNRYWLPGMRVDG